MASITIVGASTSIHRTLKEAKYPFPLQMLCLFEPHMPFFLPNYADTKTVASFIDYFTVLIGGISHLPSSTDCLGQYKRKIKLNSPFLGVGSQLATLSLLGDLA